MCIRDRDIPYTAQMIATITCQQIGTCLLYTSCTESQRRRFLLYALDGLTLAEIGTVCGCSKVSVYESIDAVRKKFLKFFANYPNE